MRNKANVINTIPPTTDYPFGRIKNDTGVNDGTPIVEENNGDIQETVTGLMQRAKITPNGLPDNVTNGYQIMDAVRENGGKFDMIHKLTKIGNELVLNTRLDNVYNNEFLIATFEDVNDTVNMSGVNVLKDSLGNEYTVYLYPDYNNNFLNDGRYIIQKTNDYFQVYPIVTRTVLSDIYDRLDSLETGNENSMTIVERGTYIDDTSNDSGLVVIPHNVVDVNNTRVIYTCTRSNPQTSIIGTDFSQILIDRTINNFRIAFSNFPVGSYGDKLRIDWWIVRA